MLKQDEARRIQREREKKCALHFALCFGLAGITVFASFLCANRFEETNIAVTGTAIAVAFLLWQLKRTRFYLFFTPREYTGTVQHYEVRVEHIKENLSHLPGSKYQAYDATFGDLVIADEKGRLKSKRFLYSEEYDKIEIGAKVTILRFIDRPVLEKRA